MGGDTPYNPKGAGRKKVYDRSAFMMLSTIKKMHRTLLDTDLTKDQRDPVVRELNIIKAFLEKLSYEPREEDLSEGDKLLQKDTSRTSQDILDSNKELVQDLIVKGHSIMSIKKEIYKLTRELIHVTTLRSYRDKYKKTEHYYEAMEEYVGGIDSMRLYSKVGRIEELTTLYEDVKTRYEVSPTRENQNQLLKILDQARRESTTPQIYSFQMTQNNMNINGQVTFNLLNREVEKDVFKKLPIQEIILGRIAAKTGTDPIILMEKLHSSYYAVQSGIQGLDQIDNDIKYPSEFMYDIEDMASKQKLIKSKENQRKEEVKKQRESDEKIDVKELRERMKQAIERKRNQ